jgi:hypothetical protein
MTNVIRLAFRSQSARPLSPDGGLHRLLEAFALHRRRTGDPFWLKENAEVLGILAATGQRVPEAALAVYRPFLDGAADMLAFHPQYYRLVLNVVVNLETLGMPGGLAGRMADRIIAEDWPASEVNDLQRAEVRHLLSRAGHMVEMPGLTERLIAFASRPRTFALPNPRAAYDLVHAVFYLGDYGRRPLHLPSPVLESLHMLGCLAHLEQNADLLAEVCIALRHAGQQLPALWAEFLATDARKFRIDSVPCPDSSDAYHNYLVSQWLIGTMGDTAFTEIMGSGPMSFRLPALPVSPLREWSQALLALGPSRSGDWGVMRSACASKVSARAMAIADAGAAGSPGFDAFFRSFARADEHPGPGSIRGRA